MTGGTEKGGPQYPRKENFISDTSYLKWGGETGKDEEGHEWRRAGRNPSFAPEGMPSDDRAPRAEDAISTNIDDEFDAAGRRYFV